MKTVLVTGSNGFLGQKLTENILKRANLQLIATSKGDNRFSISNDFEYVAMDLLNPEQVAQVVAQHKPNAIIHTAAVTSVEGCEKDKELCYDMNVNTVQTLISICEKHDIQLIHLSTDFIFDGKTGPYSEEDKPNPVNYYGETKLAAENLIQQSKAKWVILRTILVYGVPHDSNRSTIVLWAKNALESGNSINVVNNQWRMPTLIEDLAEACLLAVEKEAQGVFHISGKDMMSISEIVNQVADFWNLDRSLINEISSESLNQDRNRPVRTGFNLDKASTVLGYQPHSFSDGLAIVATQLQKK